MNTFFSRAVRLQTDRDQHVIDAKHYKLIGHPIYAVIIVWMISVPLLLGSLLVLTPGLIVDVLFVIRIALQDHILRLELPGYDEYFWRVRYRLIPFVW